jgi:multiple antibiotic resistance protein
MDLRTMFLFFFITLGPVKAILPFAYLTTNADAHLRRSIAFMAFVDASVVVVLTALIGKGITAKWGVSTDAVAITGGAVLFIWSMQSLLRMQHPPPVVAPPSQPTHEIAITPITLPTVVTPAGIAAILYFTMSRPDGDWRSLGTILALLMLVMILNLIGLMFAREIIKIAGGRITFLVLGAILAVVQNALAVQILIQAVRRLA